MASSSDDDAGRFDQQAQTASRVSLLLKTPSSLKEVLLELPLSATVADLHRRITEEYDGRPSPSRQTVSLTTFGRRWFCRDTSSAALLPPLLSRIRQKLTPFPPRDSTEHR
jgi:hypothetical protein